MKPTISAKRPTRFPSFPYRANPLWPHDRNDGPGELVMSALSGAWFPKIYAVEGPYGLVDGRDGGTVDLDADAHEVAINMLGPIPTQILPNG